MLQARGWHIPLFCDMSFVELRQFLADWFRQGQGSCETQALPRRSAVQGRAQLRTSQKQQRRPTARVPKPALSNCEGSPKALVLIGVQFAICFDVCHDALLNPQGSCPSNALARERFLASTSCCRRCVQHRRPDPGRAWSRGRTPVFHGH